MRSKGFVQCAGTNKKSTMGRTFFKNCVAKDSSAKIVFACSSNNDQKAEFVSPAFSLSGKSLTDNTCDNWNGAALSIFGKDYILSVDRKRNPKCGSYSVSYDMYVHFGTQWGCLSLIHI